MGCGCRKYIEEMCSQEFEIPDIKYESEPQILLPVLKEDYNDLKCQIINEYLDILKQLECGQHPDLEIILEEMSLIEADKYGEL